jgi:hypothetical protein
MDDVTPEVDLSDIRRVVTVRYITTGELYDPCYAFKDAVCALFLDREIRSSIEETFEMDTTWEDACTNIAKLAVRHGASVAAVMFLATIHLKE